MFPSEFDRDRVAAGLRVGRDADGDPEGIGLEGAGVDGVVGEERVGDEAREVAEAVEFLRGRHGGVVEQRNVADTADLDGEGFGGSRSGGHLQVAVVGAKGDLEGYGLAARGVPCEGASLPRSGAGIVSNERAGQPSVHDGNLRGKTSRPWSRLPVHWGMGFGGRD